MTSTFVTVGRRDLGLLLFLNMLESFDLKEMGYNSPEYIHHISQVINLGFSDSHKYIGDPSFTKTPTSLYTKAYAGKRAGLVDPQKAFSDMPPWGDPESMEAVATDSPRQFTIPSTEDAVPSTGQRELEDTTSLNVMDRAGNVFSMTESDGAHDFSYDSRLGIWPGSSHDPVQSRPQPRKYHGTRKTPPKTPITRSWS